MEMEKDLAALREEHRQLMGQQTRYALLSIALLFLLTNAFSLACSRVNGDEVRGKLSEIEELSKLTGRKPELSFIFHFFDAGNGSATVPAAAAAPRPAAVAILDEQKKQAESQQLQLAHDLEAKADGWFTISTSILGTKLDIDTRYWIALLPALLWFFGSYLFIVRTKLRVIERLAAHRLRADAVGASTLDRLLFDAAPGQPTAFARHPLQLGTLLYGLGVAGILAELTVAGWPLWSSSDGGAFLLLLPLLAIVTFYLAAYSRYVARCLTAQAAALLGEPPAPQPFHRVWIKVVTWGEGAARVLRKRPLTSLASGSLLTLLSLFLATATSCGNGNRRGYELVLGQQRATWFTGGFLSGFSDQLLGRFVYTASQVLAVLTLLLVIAALLRRRGLRGNGWTAGLRRISVVFSLFLLVDFGFVSPFGVTFVSDVLRLVYWVVPLALWCRYTLRPRPVSRERWLVVRSGLLILYAPGVLLAVATLVSVVRRGLVGLPVYFVGLHLMTLGYLGISDLRVLVPSARPVEPVATAHARHETMPEESTA